MDWNNFKLNNKMENKANKYFRDDAYFMPFELYKAALKGYILQSVVEPNIILYVEKKDKCPLLVGMEIDWLRDGRTHFRITGIKSVLKLKEYADLLEIFETDKGRLYNILYCDEAKFYDAYQRLKKCTPLISESHVAKPHPLHKPIEVGVLNKYNLGVHPEHSAAYSMGVQRGDVKPEPMLTYHSENEARKSAMLANAELMYQTHVYNRRAGHTTTMFMAYLRHIQHHADRVVIVAANEWHKNNLRITERYIIHQLRQEHKERTKPSFFRSWLIKLGFAKLEPYQELGELHIVPLHKLQRFTEGTKSIIVFDNFVFLDLPNPK